MSEIRQIARTISFGGSEVRTNHKAAAVLTALAIGFLLGYAIKGNFAKLHMQAADTSCYRGLISFGIGAFALAGTLLTLYALGKRTRDWLRERSLRISVELQEALAKSGQSHRELLQAQATFEGSSGDEIISALKARDAAADKSLLTRQKVFKLQQRQAAIHEIINHNIELCKREVAELTMQATEAPVEDEGAKLAELERKIGILEGEEQRANKDRDWATFLLEETEDLPNLSAGDCAELQEAIEIEYREAKDDSLDAENLLYEKMSQYEEEEVVDRLEALVYQQRKRVLTLHRALLTVKNFQALKEESKGLTNK